MNKPMSKRSFLGRLAALPFALPFALPSPSFAQASAASRIALLNELVKTIGAAGEAMTKLTEGFRTLVVAGKDSYNYVAAEREKARLIEISRRTARLISTQNATVIHSIGQYLARRIKTQSDWEQVAQNFASTLQTVQALLADVQKEDGSFVLEPAYLALNQALSGREQILTELLTMPAPISKEELALLSEANERYKVLVQNAEKALTELNAYVKAKQA